MQDMAYVDGHVYLAGFTQGNASFHSVHVTNGPTGPATDPDKVTVDHASSSVSVNVSAVLLPLRMPV